MTASLESEVTGNEDPNILHAYISCLPSFVAFKEGMSNITCYIFSLIQDETSDIYALFVGIFQFFLLQSYVAEAC